MIPQVPAFLCPVLDFLLCLKQECPTAAASHHPCRYGEGGSARRGRVMFGCRKERQAPLPAAVPVLRDHAHLLFFHLFA